MELPQQVRSQMEFGNEGTELFAFFAQAICVWSFDKLRMTELLSAALPCSPNFLVPKLYLGTFAVGATLWPFFPEGKRGQNRVSRKQAAFPSTTWERGK